MEKFVLKPMPDSDNMYHELTGIVFNPNNRAIGRNINDKMVPLNRESIAICNQYGYKYLGDIEDESTDGDNEGENEEEYNNEKTTEENHECNDREEMNVIDNDKESNEDKYEFNCIEKSISDEDDHENENEIDEFDFIVTEIEASEDTNNKEVESKCSDNTISNVDDLNSITICLTTVVNNLNVICNRLQQYVQKNTINNRVSELEKENTLLKDQLAEIKRVVLNNFKI